MLKGKFISILGDSISTYQGVSNDRKTQATLYDHPCFYREPFPLEKTYWMRLIDSLELRLCVNNSWSGGNLSGQTDETSGVNRAHYLSAENGTHPDLIIVFMGINDLGRRIEASTFAFDYEQTLRIIQEKHPAATVYCVNLPDRDALMKKQTEIFNNAISKAAKSVGENIFVVDLFGSRLRDDVYYQNTLDGLHPDEDGMKIIAEVIEETIQNTYQES